MRIIPATTINLKNQIKEWAIANGDAEDVVLIQEWLDLESIKSFEGKELNEILAWMPDNLINRVNELKSSQVFHNTAGVPSESELEDAYNWASSLGSFDGSEKQKQWASNIAEKNITKIALAWKQGKEVPISAKWWIDNRNNIWF
jgi:hypothetical protein